MTIEISVTGLSAIVSSALNIGDAVELHPIADGIVCAEERHNVGKLYGFEFVGLTAKQRRKIARECRDLPIYNRNSLGI
jgi:hypothetical protein